MKKTIFMISAVLLSSTSFASNNYGADYGGQRVQRQQAAVQRTELTPNEKLIMAVEGCKSGVAVMTGLLNPVAGLMVAAYPSSESQDDLREIQQALDAGADINYRDGYSWTALMHAAYGGYPGIVEFLLKKGAQRDLVVTERSFRDWRGYTAQKLAQYYYDQYQGFRKDCEPKMIEHYDGKIARYGRIVALLK